MPASSQVQKAVYDLLIAANINGVDAIRDHPLTEPSNSDYPFIEIGDTQDLPNDAGQSDGSTDTGTDTFLDVHTWSRYRGKKEAKYIMDAVYGALHHKTLTIAGRSSAFCWVDGSRLLDDPDGITRHGIQTFKITHRS